MPTPIRNADRDREILIQRAEGESLARIGSKHGISRQRVHAILRTAGSGAADPDKIEAELYAFIGELTQAQADEINSRKPKSLTILPHEPFDDPEEEASVSAELYSSLTEGNGFSVEAARDSFLGSEDEEDANISAMLNASQKLHDIGLMSEERLNEMKRMGGEQ